MVATLARSLLALAIATGWNGSASAQACDKGLLHQLENDKTLTTMQRQKAADDQCIGKVITAVGSVNDVSTGNSVELVGADGLRFDVYLAPTHRCGDLIRIQKGQRLAVQGQVFKVLIGRREYVMKEAACVK